MLYNKDLKKVRTTEDCMTCHFYDKKNKKCTVLGKACFEFDPVARVCIDPVTKLPIKFK